MAHEQAFIRNFITPLRGSGRTAPSLLEDLTLYDPRRPPQPGRNVLEDPRHNFVASQPIGASLPPDSCRHDYCVQHRQSTLPVLDETPSPDTVWQVAATCRKCRGHVLLKIDYTVAWKAAPCPTAGHPLHHFVRSTWRQDAARRDLDMQSRGGADQEIYIFECSSASCSAVCSVLFSPPVLTDEAVFVLTDKDLLRLRTEAAFDLKKGHTEGMKRPSPLEVLVDLRAYISNAWRKEARTEISLENKRFAVRFGPEGTACRDVLELLQFTFQPESSWQIPQPDHTEPPPVQKPLNVFLDNVEAELSMLILGRPDDERRIAQDLTTVESASQECSRILSCQNYDRVRGQRSNKANPEDRARQFTLLGIPEDASDELVIFAYQRQLASNPTTTQVAQFLSSLNQIQVARQSDTIATQVAVELSMGRAPLETLQDAYRSIGLSMDSPLDDDTIVGAFQARLRDAPAHEREMRDHLHKIGEHRGSRRLVDLAQNAMETYEDALQFLDLTTGTAESFISSMYTARVAEDPSSVTTARRAVEIIAKHRNSAGLLAFVAAGFQGEVEDFDTTMDTAEAFRILDVDDRTLDDNALYAVYQLRVEDDPTNATRIQRAIEVIAGDDHRAALRGMLKMPQGAVTKQRRALLTEPVGLENIGNTCYLNSLLQWLFTISPLRDIARDFDSFKMELSDETMTRKKVGQRSISRREVEMAQKFAVRLGELFQAMITSSSRAIRPAQELARLTLETDLVKKGRRSSTLPSARRPTLGHIDSRPILGPLPKTTLEATSPTTEQPLLSPEVMETAPPSDPARNGEEAELQLPVARSIGNHVHTDGPVPAGARDDDEVTESAVRKQQQAILDDKENVTPAAVKPGLNPDPTHDVRQVSKPEPLAPASPSKINAQAGTLVKQRSDLDAAGPAGDFHPPSRYDPPPGPPPIPPRKPVDTSKETLEEYARQQDVTEVVSHSIFQLSCAIRPTGFHASGEQQDEVRDMFFGESRYHTPKAGSRPSEPIPFLSIPTPIFNDPKDVYAALDNEFDLAPRDNGDLVYQSITKLPPVLTIGYGRVVFDEATLQQKKVNCHVDMPVTIYMDRYMDAPDESALTRRRKQTWTLKRQLARYLSRRDRLEKDAIPSVGSVFDQTRSVLEHLQTLDASEPGLGDLQVSDDMVHSAGVLGESLHAERAVVDDTIQLLRQQISDSFTDSAFRTQEYKLHAAFFHRGTVGSGHYWVYIYDHRNELWRKYNDDYVTPVDNLKEIFADPSNDPSNPNHGYSPANPYFVVYVRADEIDKGLVETVKRDAIAEDDVPGWDGRGDGDGDTRDDDVMLYPLGQGPHIVDREPDFSHHEFAGQASQMSHMPPERGHRVRDRADTAPSNTNGRTTEEIQKQGDWDNSEAFPTAGRW